MKDLKLTLLGTGTSHGVPVIACDCVVCNSQDPKDSRLRTSGLVSDGITNILIDCGPDMRQQLLRENVKHIDAILITHEHNDHIVGLDDIRPLNYKQESYIKIYATPEVQEELKMRFAYVFYENPYPGSPKIELLDLPVGQFKIGNIEIETIELIHGNIPCTGYRFGDLAYLTDFKLITDDQLAKLKDLKYLVIDALHHKEHHAHLNLTESLALIERIKVPTAYLIHISHQMGKAAVINDQLPSNIQLAYDGQIIDFNQGKLHE